MKVVCNHLTIAERKAKLTCDDVVSSILQRTPSDRKEYDKVIEKVTDLEVSEMCQNIRD